MSKINIETMVFTSEEGEFTTVIEATDWVAEKIMGKPQWLIDKNIGKIISVSFAIVNVSDNKKQFLEFKRFTASIN